jgi:hypothetical protein
MGMTGGLVRATVEEITHLREHRSELPEFLDCGIWAPPTREVRPKGILGWLLRLTPVRIYENDPDAVPPAGADNGPIRPSIDLDKAWEPLHFLLTGSDASGGDEPACYLAHGGEELADDMDDDSYSSIRALTPQQVASFERYLESLTVDELRGRFDMRRMIELRIYSRSRRSKGSDGDEATLEHLVEAFEELRMFVRGTVASGAGAIAYLT